MLLRFQHLIELAVGRSKTAQAESSLFPLLTGHRPRVVRHVKMSAGVIFLLSFTSPFSELSECQQSP